MPTDQQIADAIKAIDMANNGYADIGRDPRLCEALHARGYVVIATQDLHGNAVFRGFTRRAQQCLGQEPFGQSTYKPIKPRDLGPDYEELILREQERQGFYD